MTNQKISKDLKRKALSVLIRYLNLGYKTDWYWKDCFVDMATAIGLTGEKIRAACTQAQTMIRGAIPYRIGKQKQPDGPHPWTQADIEMIWHTFTAALASADMAYEIAQQRAEASARKKALEAQAACEKPGGLSLDELTDIL